MTTSFPPINFPNKPVPPFTAEPPKNPFPGFFPDMWKNMKGRPYLTVSSKGLANGLSEYFNDGADFGPDSLQSDGSLTQTVGIQEAINYVFTQKGGKIILKKGIYDLTSAPFQPYRGSSTGGCKILIPENNITENDIIPIHIFGESSVWNETEYNSGTTSNPPNFGVVIQSLDDASSLGITGNINVIFGVYNPINITNPAINGVDVTLDQISFVTLAGNGIGGVDMSGAASMTIPNLVIGVNSPWPIPEPSSTVNSVGFVGNLSGTNKNIIGNLFVYGYYTGVTIGSHTHASTLFIFACYYAFSVLPVNHGSQIDFMDVEWNTNLFYFPDIMGLPTLTLHITKIVISDNQDPSGMSWANASSYVSNGITSNPVILIVDIWEHAYRQLSSLQAGIEAPGGTVRIGYIYPGSYAVPTLSTNPPVSGTVYQNTNPYDIEIDLPVYATTSGTAGYVTIAKGSTDTPTAIGNQYVSGDTSSTSTQIIRVRVPAGWYYSFTGSGVTFATATPFAD